MNKLIAIHQPNFIPWLGYFHKISQVDQFVFLDDVKYSASGGMYPRRTRINSKHGPKWLAAPIKNLKDSNQKMINTLEIESVNDLVKMIGSTLKDNYEDYPHFREVTDFIMDLAGSAERNLSKFNINVIEQTAKLLLKNPPEFKLSSELGVSSTGTERLIDIAEKLEAGDYLSGSGSNGYLINSEFSRRGIGLRFQEQLTYIYPQRETDEFVKGLSILDPLMNIGFSGTKEILNQC
jgi:hypothetical protein